MDETGEAFPLLCDLAARVIPTEWAPAVIVACLFALVLIAAIELDGDDDSTGYGY